MSADPRAGAGGRRGALACLLGALLALAAPRPASAQEAVTLDRDRVVALARARAPSVATAAARVGEARALHVGARSLAPENPTVTLRAGPRFVAGSSDPLLDLNLSLSWPFDVSGARGARSALADAATEAAEAEVADAQRLAAARALDLWVRARGAAEGVRLAEARASLDAALVQSARSRRDAGSGSDLDVALATVEQADSAARVEAARGEREAFLATLRGELGVPAEASVGLVGDLEEPAAPPLEALLASLPRRPDLAVALLAVRAAQADARLQGRLGVPLPSFSFQGGRENEYFAQGGLEVPLPIYQRNQTVSAVATARVVTRQAERVAGLARAEAELRSAYAGYEGTRAALATLRAADDAVGLTERLATRAYELGQRDLASALVARRSAAEARQRRLETLVALARARVAVDQAAGRGR
jgi:cobalt-zinc-cadmium efflux system outer membrane protein